MSDGGSIIYVFGMLGGLHTPVMGGAAFVFRVPQCFAYSQSAGGFMV
ncbi:MAG: hypothetical protein QW297_02175 [Candidatus Jordarchaeales archaeon]